MHYREAIGLDVGAHSAKAVRLERVGGVLSVRQSAWVRLPVSASERQRVLKSFVAKNGWTNLPCVVPVQGEGVLLHGIVVAGEDNRGPDEIVKKEMDQFSGLVEQGTISDFALQRRVAGRRSILLAVGRLDRVLDGVTFFRDLGLRVIDVFPSALALFNAVVKLARVPFRKAFVCVGIGHESTHVLVGRKGNVLFARRLPMGAGSFEDGRLEAWLEELDNALKLHVSQLPGKDSDPRQIILCGGGALTEGLKEKVRRKTGVETVVLSEVVHASWADELERYGTAYGLALRAFGKGTTALSLLPRGMREDLILRWQKKFWAMSGAALGLTTLILIAGAYLDAKALRGRLHERQQRLSELQALEQRLEAVDALNDNLHMQRIPFVRAVHNGEILRAVIHAIGESKHPDDWITLIADAESYAEEGQEKPTATRETRASRRSGTPRRDFTQVVIEGYTPVEDLSTVRTMIEALRNSPGIAGADLLADDRVNRDEARDERWAMMRCRLFAVEITVPTP